MAKLTNGIKGLESVWRQPEILKGPEIPKTGDVLKDFALLGAIGAIGALVKVLKDGWDW